MRLHVALLAATLAGCAVGPEYRRPAPPAVASYTAEALPVGTATAPGVAGATQRFVSGGEIPSRWWELFRSQALDRWIREALAKSPTLGAAEATLRRAQEFRRARAGELLPGVDGNASASRQRPSAASLGAPNAQVNPFTLYNASVNVSYTLDLFGKTRRELEALQAQVDYQGFQLKGAYLTLTSNIVTAAFQEASLRGQLQATREILATQEELLALVEKQFELGGIARTDVLAQRASLAQSRATLPPLEKRLAQTRHLLAVLAGRFPGNTADLPEFDLKEFHLPEDLPVSLPSSLARQRPDIRSAEEQLHAASAAVGVATANLYPHVTLSGQYGTATTRIGDLFGPGSAVWGIRSRTAAAHLPRRGAGGDPSRRGRRLRPGRRAVSRDGPAGVPRGGGCAPGVGLRRDDAQGAIGRGSRRKRYPGHRDEAAPLRCDELPLAAQRAASVPPGADPPGPGAGRAVCRHRRAVPGARGRVVES